MSNLWIQYIGNTPMHPPDSSRISGDSAARGGQEDAVLHRDDMLVHQPLGRFGIVGANRIGDRLMFGLRFDDMVRNGRRDLAVTPRHKLGRASGRERVCPYVSISVYADALKKKNKT